MLFKERSEKSAENLKTEEKYFLPLQYTNFIANQGDIYVENLINRKVYLIKPDFIGMVEKTVYVSDYLRISKKGIFEFNYLKNYQLSIGGIIFNGDNEMLDFLSWIDKVI